MEEIKLYIYLYIIGSKLRMYLTFINDINTFHRNLNTFDFTSFAKLTIDCNLPMPSKLKRKG